MSGAASSMDVLHLTWALVNDQLDADRASQLERLVVNDSEARRTYLATVDLIAGLEWGEIERTGVRSQESGVISLAAGGEVAEIFGVELSSHRPVVPSPHRSAGWLTRSSARTIMAVAAVYYAVAAGLFWSLSLQPQLSDEGGSIANSEHPSSAVVASAEIRDRNRASFEARLVGGRNAQWNVPTTIGGELPAGPLELTAGVAEIVFGDGARASLRAPARIEITSPSAAKLHSGTLTAHVPPRAIGFTVKTPTAEIVDLGTEFAVDVLADGLTHLRVLQGKVSVVSTTLATAHKQVLVAGEMRSISAPNLVGGATDGGAEVPSRDQFVRRAPRQPGPMLVEQGGSFAPNNLALLPSAKPFASNWLRFATHSIEGLNDGQYGNSSSWIAETGATPFAGISLGGKHRIASIAFGRDNGNDVPDERPEPYTDRCAGLYTLQVTTVENPNELTPDTEWQTVGTINQGGEELDIATGRFKPYLRHRYDFPSVEATGLRLVISSPDVAIDEIEVYGAR